MIVARAVLAEIEPGRSGNSAGLQKGDPSGPPVLQREVSPMPKLPKPFFRSARQAWFVQVAG